MDFFVDGDDLDDDGGEVLVYGGGRGVWWRVVVDLDKVNSFDEDEEFGDFVMVEDDKVVGGGGDNVVFKFFVVNLVKDVSI